ncbi:MAG: phosphoenolpyruvate--protein phosphotransferase [Limisphaerales bacterium]
MPSPNRSGELVLRGIAASPGVSRGRIYILTDAPAGIDSRTLDESEIEPEIERLGQALVDTRLEVQSLQRRLAEGIGFKDAAIFEVHLLILEDPVLLNESSRRIREQYETAGAAFGAVARQYVEMLGALDDPFFRERAADIRADTPRVHQRHTGGPGPTRPPTLHEPDNIVSHDLTPSMTAQLDRRFVLGFATDVGSRTSHTAILARSLGLPAVVGLHTISSTVLPGQPALLDGHTGSIFINPTDQTLFEYGQLARRRVQIEKRLAEIRDQPAVTLDGSRVVLSANIELAEDAPSVLEAGADGVGLFRTEYLFLQGECLPDEEAQLAAYRAVAEALKPNAVIIRTLDIGGDKFSPHLKMPHEVNPSLGWRAIRFCLQERDLFRTQLRAILRASAFGSVKIMYPMVSGVDELIQANALLGECRDELTREGLAFDPDLEVGAMIEVPSAVLISRHLARHVQFFSIGTNDLIQYSLAIDRLNDKIAHLYEPTHPAVLQSIHMTVEAARNGGLWVGVCGEMASDPALVPLLLGLGVNELSVAAAGVPRVKHIVRACRLGDAQKLAQWALDQSSGAEILRRAEAFARSLAPDLFDSSDMPIPPESCSPS